MPHDIRLIPPPAPAYRVPVLYRFVPPLSDDSWDSARISKSLRAHRKSPAGTGLSGGNFPREFPRNSIGGYRRNSLAADGGGG